MKRGYLVFGILLVGVAMGFVAHAMMGTPGGATTNVMKFAGVLTDNKGNVPQGPQTLSFEFDKGATRCKVQATTTPDPSTGAFSVDLPIDSNAGIGCDANFFDGSDITYSILVGQTLVTDMNNPPTISPVPYAKYSDTAATALNAALGSPLATQINGVQTSVQSLQTTLASPTYGMSWVNSTTFLNGWTTVVFTTAEKDSYKLYDPTTGNMTAQKAGWYEVSVQIRTQPTTWSTNDHLDLTLEVNGHTVRHVSSYNLSEAGNNRSESITAIIYLNTNDTVHSEAYSTVNTTLAGSGENWFSATYVGP